MGELQKLERKIEDLEAQRVNLWSLQGTATWKNNRAIYCQGLLYVLRELRTLRSRHASDVATCDDDHYRDAEAEAMSATCDDDRAQNETEIQKNQLVTEGSQ